MPQYKSFAPYPQWDPDKEGTATWCLAKMYWLLFKKDSLFYIEDNLIFIKYYDAGEQPYDCFKFQDRKHGKLYLYYPDDGFTAYYRKSKTDREIGIQDTSFDECFDMIKKTIKAESRSNKRFVLPIFETGFTGYGHVVTMVIDYKASNQSLNVVVYDSIGRGTVADFLATLMKGKYESTSDNTLRRYLTKKFKRFSYKRVGYDHQNRRSNSHCGLFSFRVIHHAISSFMSQGIGQLSIPTSFNIDDTDTNFLTTEQIDIIKRCIHECDFSFDDFCNLMLREGEQTPSLLRELSYEEEFPPLGSIPASFVG